MENKETSSFRDPSGYIFYKDDNVYRKINKCYLDVFKKFNSSELCQELLEDKMLIKHEIIEEKKDSIILKVDKVPFINYPYEWCFSELKDAALLTLKIERECLNHGFTLKDASAYNIQFIGCKPIFIDTLSFDIYTEGTAWLAYGQFCRHFIAPLLLMSKVDERLNSLLKNYIDGIPIDLAKNILKNRGGLIAWEHIVLHDNSIKKNNKKSTSNVVLSKKNLLNFIDMMIRQIESLKAKSIDTEWEYYYDNTNYSDISFKQKQDLVSEFLDKININKDEIVFDMGANDGTFSRIALNKNAYVLAMDIDINAVNRNYTNLRFKSDRMLPLLFDFNNPSPSIGFDLRERKSLKERIKPKCVLSLALIHHICISNNVSFDDYFHSISDMGEYLIIEFVPKDDSKVIELLETRNDIFTDYDVENFEKCASNYYTIIEKKEITDSKRILYLMENKNEKSKKRNSI